MFNKRTKIVEIFKKKPVLGRVTVMGWVRNFRNNQFIALNDGSCNTNLQVVAALGTVEDGILKRIHTSTSISATGTIVASVGKGQDIEMIADEIVILGDSDPESYPLQPKKHSLEFLREIAHLRFRTNTFGCVFRIRHTLAFAVHRYFNERGFLYMHTPIITASDAEGAGEMFKVTTLPFEHTPRKEDGSVDYTEDFFGRQTHLTVSGQLEGELAATAFSEIYTFGPTFRAENSNTARHLAEFWMIEPEMAFYDLDDNMDLAEDFIRSIIATVIQENAEDLDFLSRRLEEEEKNLPVDKRSGLDLRDKLRLVTENSFERITYTDAVDILLASPAYRKGKFKYDVVWGNDLQSEHERYLVEKEFKKPLIVKDYPRDIKAFYMRSNDDRRTVAAMDILAPGIGEIVGGSQREERMDRLVERMRQLNIPTEELYWYLDTRRYGTVPHSGFGLGFERLVQFVTGMSNIRDVIPFPRTPKSASF